MVSPEELADLIRRAQQLDETAFERLVDLYSARLYGFLLRLTGRREDAEDLVQEVFVRVVRSIAEYEHDGQFDGWLFRIAVNLARDRIRRIRRSPAVGSLEESSNPGSSGVDAAYGRNSTAGERPENRMELAEDLDRLQAAMNRLSEPERKVVLLRHYGCMSFPRIAELMETPLGTALARAHRGLAKLREWMEADQ